jgi:hypothetical protein
MMVGCVQTFPERDRLTPAACLGSRRGPALARQAGAPAAQGGRGEGSGAIGAG